MTHDGLPDLAKLITKLARNCDGAEPRESGLPFCVVGRRSEVHDAVLPDNSLSAAGSPAALLQSVHDRRVVRHLRFKEVPLCGVILASWAIAFIEYCFAVPANRYGNAVYSAAQLKTMQEVITLLVFSASRSSI
jgi:hypothetical protein